MNAASQVTVMEAARALGKSKSAIWKRIRTNHIVTARTGNVVTVRLGDVATEDEMQRVLRSQS